MESTGHDLNKGFLGIFCNFDLSGVEATIYIFNLRKGLLLPLTFISFNIKCAHYTICRIQKQSLNFPKVSISTTKIFHEALSFVSHKKRYFLELNLLY